MFLVRTCAEQLAAYDLSLKFRELGVLDEGDSLATLPRAFSDAGRSLAVEPPPASWPPAGETARADP